MDWSFCRSASGVLAVEQMELQSAESPQVGLGDGDCAIWYRLTQLCPLHAVMWDNDEIDECTFYDEQLRLPLLIETRAGRQRSAWPHNHVSCQLLIAGT